jgi:hypothetical protein
LCGITQTEETINTYTAQWIKGPDFNVLFYFNLNFAGVGAIAELDCVFALTSALFSLLVEIL